MALFTPWKDKNQYNRTKWITTKADPARSKHRLILEGLARNDNSSKVRAAAFKKLGMENSQEALAAEIQDVSSTQKKKIALLEKLNDQKLLAGIVQSKSYREVRVAALQRITDRDVLKEVAKEAKEDWLCIALIQKLNDQAFLSRMANNHESYGVRKKAQERMGIEESQEALADALHHGKRSDIGQIVGKLSDQTKLEYIAQNDPDEEIRIKAVNKLENKQILAGISEKDEAYQVRKAAFIRLGHENSQEALADLAKNDDNKTLCKQSAERITDPVLLLDIVKNARFEGTAASAVKQINDQTILTEIAGSNLGEKIRLAALKNISDQQAIHEIVQKPASENFLKAAIKKLTDQDLLINLAKNQHYSVSVEAFEALKSSEMMEELAVTASNREIRRKALEKVTNQSLLSDLAIKDKDQDVCKAALARVTDQDYLSNVAKDANLEEIRESAIEGLQDQDLLKHIAIGDDKQKLRKAATMKLDEQAVLEHIAVEDKDFFVRAVAVSRLSDQQLLSRIIEEEPSDYVRFAAVEALDNYDLLERIVRKEKNGNVRYKAIEKTGIADIDIIKELTEDIQHGSAEVLRLLYSEGKLTDEARMLILKQEGKTIRKHDDNPGCQPEDHQDTPARFFEI